MADGLGSRKMVDDIDNGSISSVATTISGIVEFKERLEKLSQTANGLLESIDKVILKRRAASKSHPKKPDNHDKRTNKNIHKSNGSSDEVDDKFLGKRQSSNASYSPASSEIEDIRAKNKEHQVVANPADRHEKDKNIKSSGKDFFSNRTKRSSNDGNPNRVFIDEIAGLLNLQNKEADQQPRKHSDLDRNRNITMASYLLKNNKNYTPESNLDEKSDRVLCECGSKCPLVRGSHNRDTDEQTTFTSTTTRQHSKGSGDYVSSGTNSRNYTEDKSDFSSLTRDERKTNVNKTDSLTKCSSQNNDSFTISDITDVTHKRDKQLISSAKASKEQKQSKDHDASLSQLTTTSRVCSKVQSTHSEATEESEYSGESITSEYTSSFENYSHPMNFENNTKMSEKSLSYIGSATENSENVSMALSAHPVSCQSLTRNRAEHFGALNLSTLTTSFSASTELPLVRTRMPANELCSSNTSVPQLSISEKISCSQVQDNSKPSDSIAKSFTSTTSFIQSIANNKNCSCCENAKCFRCQKCIAPNKLQQNNYINGLSIDSLYSGHKKPVKYHLPPLQNLHHEMHSGNRSSTSQFSECSDTFNNARKSNETFDTGSALLEVKSDFSRRLQITGSKSGELNSFGDTSSYSQGSGSSSSDHNFNSYIYGDSIEKSLTTNASTAHGQQGGTNSDSISTGFTSSFCDTTTTKLTTGRTQSDISNESYDSDETSRHSKYECSFLSTESRTPNVKAINKNLSTYSPSETDASTDKQSTEFSASYIHKTTASGASDENPSSSHIKSMCMYSDFFDAEGNGSIFCKSQHSEKNEESSHDKSFIIDTLGTDSKNISESSLHKPSNSEKTSVYLHVRPRNKLACIKSFETKEELENSENMATTYTTSLTEEEFQHSQRGDNDNILSDYVKEKSLPYTDAAFDSLPVAESELSDCYGISIDSPASHFGETPIRDLSDLEEKMVLVQNKMTIRQKRSYKKEETETSSFHSRRSLCKENPPKHSYRADSSEKTVDKTNASSFLPSDSVISKSLSLTSSASFSSKMDMQAKKKIVNHKQIPHVSPVLTKHKTRVRTFMASTESEIFSCSCGASSCQNTQLGLTSGFSTEKTPDTSIELSVSSSASSEFNSEIDQSYCQEFESNSVCTKTEATSSFATSCSCKRSSCNRKPSEDKLDSVLSSNLDSSTNPSILKERQQATTRNNFKKHTNERKNHSGISRKTDINQGISDKTSSQIELSYRSQSVSCLQDASYTTSSCDSTSGKTNSDLKFPELSATSERSKQPTSCSCTKSSCLNENQSLGFSSISSMKQSEITSSENTFACSSAVLGIDQDFLDSNKSSQTTTDSTKITTKSSSISINSFSCTIDSSKLDESVAGLKKAQHTSCSCENSSCLQSRSNNSSVLSETTFPCSSAAIEIELGLMESTKNSCSDEVSKDITPSCIASPRCSTIDSMKTFSDTKTSKLGDTKPGLISSSCSCKKSSCLMGKSGFESMPVVGSKLSIAINENHSSPSEGTFLCSSIAVVVDPAFIENNNNSESEIKYGESAVSISVSTGLDSSCNTSFNTKISDISSTRKTDVSFITSEKVPPSNEAVIDKKGARKRIQVIDKEKKSNPCKYFQMYGKTKFSSETSIVSCDLNTCPYKEEYSKNLPTVTSKISSTSFNQTSSTSCSACKQLWNDESLHYSSEELHFDPKTRIQTEATRETIIVTKSQSKPQVDHICHCCKCLKRAGQDLLHNMTNYLGGSCSKIPTILTAKNNQSKNEDTPVSNKPVKRQSINLPKEENQSIKSNLSLNKRDQASDGISSLCYSIDASFTLLEQFATSCEPSSSMHSPSYAETALSEARLPSNCSVLSSEIFPHTNHKPMVDLFQASSSSSLKKCSSKNSFFAKAKNLFPNQLSKKSLRKTKICKCKICEKRKRDKNQDDSSKRKRSSTEKLKAKELGKEKDFMAKTKLPELSPSRENIKTVNQSSDESNRLGIKKNPELQNPKDSLEALTESAILELSSDCSTKNSDSLDSLSSSNTNLGEHSAQSSRNKYSPKEHLIEKFTSHKTCKCSKCGSRKKSSRQKAPTKVPELQKPQESLETLTESAIPELSSKCCTKSSDSFTSLSSSNSTLGEPSAQSSQRKFSPKEHSVEKYTRRKRCKCSKCGRGKQISRQEAPETDSESQKPKESLEASTESAVPEISSKCSTKGSDSLASLSSSNTNLGEPSAQTGRSKFLSQENLIEKFAGHKTCKCSKCGRRKKSVGQGALKRDPELKSPKESLESLTESSIPELSSQCNTKSSDSLASLSSSNTNLGEPSGQSSRTKCSTPKEKFRSHKTCKCSKCGRRKKSSGQEAPEKYPVLQNPKESFEALTESSISQLSSARSTKSSDSLASLSSSNTNLGEPSDQSSRNKYSPKGKFRSHKTCKCSKCGRRKKILKQEALKTDTELQKPKESLEALTESAIPELSSKGSLTSYNSLASLSLSNTNLGEPSVQSSRSKCSPKEHSIKKIGSQLSVNEFRGNKKNEKLPDEKVSPPKYCYCCKCTRKSHPHTVETPADAKPAVPFKPRSNSMTASYSLISETSACLSQDITQILSLSSANSIMSAKPCSEDYEAESPSAHDHVDKSKRCQCRTCSKSARKSNQEKISEKQITTEEFPLNSEQKCKELSSQLSFQRRRSYKENVIDPSDSSKSTQDEYKRIPPPCLTDSTQDMPQTSKKLDKRTNSKCSKTSLDSKKGTQECLRKGCQCKKCSEKRKRIKAKAQKVSHRKNLISDSRDRFDYSWHPKESDLHINFTRNLYTTNAALSSSSCFGLLEDQIDNLSHSFEQKNCSHLSKDTKSNKRYMCTCNKRRQRNESDSDMEKINDVRGPKSKQTRKANVSRRPMKRPPKHYETGSSRDVKPSTETTRSNSSRVEAQPNMNNQTCPCTPCVEPVQIKSQSTSQVQNLNHREIFEVASVEVKPRDVSYPKTVELKKPTHKTIQEPCIYQATCEVRKPFNFAKAFHKPRVPQSSFNDSFESDDSDGPSDPFKLSPLYSPTKSFPRLKTSETCICNDVCTQEKEKRVFSIEVKPTGRKKPKRESKSQLANDDELLHRTNLQFTPEEPEEIEIKTTDLKLTKSQNREAPSTRLTRQKNSNQESCPCTDTCKVSKLEHIEPIETKPKEEEKVSPRSSFKSVISEYEAIVIKRKDVASNRRPFRQPTNYNSLSSESVAESLIEIKSYKDKVKKPKEEPKPLLPVSSGIYQERCPCQDPCMPKIQRKQIEPVKTKPFTYLYKPTHTEVESPIVSGMELIETKPLRLKQKTVATADKKSISDICEAKSKHDQHRPEYPQSQKEPTKPEPISVKPSGRKVQDNQMEVPHGTRSASDFKEIKDIEIKHVFTRITSPKPDVSTEVTTPPVFTANTIFPRSVDQPCFCNPCDEIPTTTESIKVKRDTNAILKSKDHLPGLFADTEPIEVKKRMVRISSPQNIKRSKSLPTVTVHPPLTNLQETQCIGNNCEKGAKIFEPIAVKPNTGTKPKQMYKVPDGRPIDPHIKLTTEEKKPIEVKKRVFRINSFHRIGENASSGLEVVFNTSSNIPKDPVEIKRNRVALRPRPIIEKSSYTFPLRATKILYNGADDPQCICDPCKTKSITVVPITVKPNAIKILDQKQISSIPRESEPMFEQEIEEIEPIEIKKLVLRVKSPRQVERTKSVPMMTNNADFINTNDTQCICYPCDRETSKPEPVRVKSGITLNNKHQVIVPHLKYKADLKTSEAEPIVIQSENVKTQNRTANANFEKEIPRENSETIETLSHVPSGVLLEKHQDSQCKCNEQCYSEPKSNQSHPVSLKSADLAKIFQMPKVLHPDNQTHKKSSTKLSEGEHFSVTIQPTVYDQDPESFFENELKDFHDAECICNRCKNRRYKPPDQNQVKTGPVKTKNTNFEQILRKPQVSQAAQDAYEFEFVKPIETKTVVSHIKAPHTETNETNEPANIKAVRIGHKREHCKCNTCQDTTRCYSPQLNYEVLSKEPVKVRPSDIAPILQGPKLFRPVQDMSEKKSMQPIEIKEKAPSSKMTPIQDETIQMSALFPKATGTQQWEKSNHVCKDKSRCFSLSHTCEPIKIEPVQVKTNDLSKLFQHPKVPSISQNDNEVLLSTPIEVKKDQAPVNKLPEPTKSPLPITEINQPNYSHCTCDVCKDRSKCQNCSLESQPVNTEPVKLKHANMVNILQKLRVIKLVENIEESSFENAVKVKNDNASINKATKVLSAMEIPHEDDGPKYEKKSKCACLSMNCRPTKSEPIASKAIDISNMLQKPRVLQSTQDQHKISNTEPVERKEQLSYPEPPAATSNVKESGTTAYVNSSATRQCQCSVCEDKSKCRLPKPDCTSVKFETIKIKSADVAKILQGPRIPDSIPEEYQVHIVSPVKVKSSTKQLKVNDDKTFISLPSKQPKKDDSPKLCKCRTCVDKTKCQSPKKDCKPLKLDPINIKLPETPKIFQKPRISQTIQDDKEVQFQEPTEVKKEVPRAERTSRPIVSLTNMRYQQHDPKSGYDICESKTKCVFPTDCRPTKFEHIAVKLTDTSKVLQKPRIPLSGHDEYEMLIIKPVDLKMMSGVQKSSNSRENVKSLKSKATAEATSSPISRQCKCSECEDKSKCHLPKPDCKLEQKEAVQLKSTDLTNILQRPRVRDSKKLESVDTKANITAQKVPSSENLHEILSIEPIEVKKETPLKSQQLPICNCSTCEDKSKCQSPLTSCDKARVELISIKPIDLSNLLQKPRIPQSMQDEHELGLTELFDAKNDPASKLKCQSPPPICGEPKIEPITMKPTNFAKMLQKPKLYGAPNDDHEIQTSAPIEDKKEMQRPIMLVESEAEVNKVPEFESAIPKCNCNICHDKSKCLYPPSKCLQAKMEPFVVKPGDLLKTLQKPRISHPVQDEHEMQFTESIEVKTDTKSIKYPIEPVINSGKTPLALSTMVFQPEPKSKECDCNTCENKLKCQSPPNACEPVKIDPISVKFGDVSRVLQKPRVPRSPKKENEVQSSEPTEVKAPMSWGNNPVTLTATGTNNERLKNKSAFEPPAVSPITVKNADISKGLQRPRVSQSVQDEHEIIFMEPVEIKKSIPRMKAPDNPITDSSKKHQLMNHQLDRKPKCSCNTCQDKSKCQSPLRPYLAIKKERISVKTSDLAKVLQKPRFVKSGHDECEIQFAESIKVKKEGRRSQGKHFNQPNMDSIKYPLQPNNIDFKYRQLTPKCHCTSCQDKSKCQNPPSVCLDQAIEPIKVKAGHTKGLQKPRVPQHLQDNNGILTNAPVQIKKQNLVKPPIKIEAKSKSLPSVPNAIELERQQRIPKCACSSCQDKSKCQSPPLSCQPVKIEPVSIKNIDLSKILQMPRVSHPMKNEHVTKSAEEIKIKTEGNESIPSTFPALDIQKPISVDHQITEPIDVKSTNLNKMLQKPKIHQTSQDVNEIQFIEPIEVKKSETKFNSPPPTISGLNNRNTKNILPMKNITQCNCNICEDRTKCMFPTRCGPNKSEAVSIKSAEATTLFQKPRIPVSSPDQHIDFPAEPIQVKKLSQDRECPRASTDASDISSGKESDGANTSRVCSCMECNDSLRKKLPREKFLCIGCLPRSVGGSITCELVGNIDDSLIINTTNVDRENIGNSSSESNSNPCICQSAPICPKDTKSFPIEFKPKYNRKQDKIQSKPMVFKPQYPVHNFKDYQHVHPINPHADLFETQLIEVKSKLPTVPKEETERIVTIDKSTRIASNPRFLVHETHNEMCQYRDCMKSKEKDRIQPVAMFKPTPAKVPKPKPFEITPVQIKPPANHTFENRPPLPKFQPVEIKDGSTATTKITSPMISERNFDSGSCVCDNICGPGAPIIDPVILKPSSTQVAFQKPRISVNAPLNFKQPTHLGKVEAKKQAPQKVKHDKEKECDCIKCGGTEICKTKSEGCKPKPVECKEKDDTVEQTLSLEKPDGILRSEDNYKKTKDENVKGMILPLDVKPIPVKIQIPIEIKCEDPVSKQIRNDQNNMAKPSPVEVKSSPINVMVPVETSQALPKSKETTKKQAQLAKDIPKAPEVPIDIKQWELKTKDVKETPVLLEQSLIEVKPPSINSEVESIPVETKPTDSKLKEAKKDKTAFVPKYPIETKSDHNIPKRKSVPEVYVVVPVETKSIPAIHREIEKPYLLPVKTKSIDKTKISKSFSSVPTSSQTVPVQLKPSEPQYSPKKSFSPQKPAVTTPIETKSTPYQSQKQLTKDNIHGESCPCTDCKREVHSKIQQVKTKSPTGVVLLNKPRIPPISLTEQTQNLQIRKVISTSHWEECSCKICQNKEDCEFGPKECLTKKRKFNFSDCCREKDRPENSVSINKQSEVQPHIPITPEAPDNSVETTKPTQPMDLQNSDTPTESISSIKPRNEKSSVEIIFSPQLPLESSGETMLCSTTTTYIESSIDTCVFCSSNEEFSSSSTSWCSCPTSESSTCICGQKNENSDKVQIICEGKQTEPSIEIVETSSTSSLRSCVSSCICIQQKTNKEPSPSKVSSVSKKSSYEDLVSHSVSESTKVNSVKSEPVCSGILSSKTEGSCLSIFSSYTCKSDESSNEICSEIVSCKCDESLSEKISDSPRGSLCKTSRSTQTCNTFNDDDSTEALENPVSLQLTPSSECRITESTASQSFRLLSDVYSTKSLILETPFGLESAPHSTVPTSPCDEESAIKKSSRKTSSTRTNNLSNRTSCSCTVCNLSTGESTVSMSSTEVKKKPIKKQPSIFQSKPSSKVSKPPFVCHNKCGCPDCPFLQQPHKSMQTTNPKLSIPRSERSRPQPCGCSTQESGNRLIYGRVEIPSAVQQPENVLRICMMPKGCSATCGGRCGFINKGCASDETFCYNSARNLLDSDTEVHGISETATTLFKFVIAELKHIKDIIQRSFNIDNVNNCLNFDNNSNNNSNNSVCGPSSNCPCMSLNQYYPQRFRNVHDAKRNCMFTDLKPFESVARLPICLNPMNNIDFNITRPLPSTTSCYPDSSVKILSVKPVGCESLMVTWMLDPVGNNDGYEIFVDNNMKCRTFTPAHNTAIVNGVDANKEHHIRVIAVPKNGQTSRNSLTLKGLFLPPERRRISAQTCYYQPQNPST